MEGWIREHPIFEPAQPTEEEPGVEPTSEVESDVESFDSGSESLELAAPDSDGGEQLKATLDESAAAVGESSAAEQVLVTEASRLQEHVQVLEVQLAETEADQRAAQSEAVRAQELQTKVSALEQQLAETRASTRAAQAEVTEVQRLRGTDVERMQGTIHELENQLSQTVAGESAARAQAEHEVSLAREETAAAVSRHSALQAENARSRTESERALEEAMAVLASVRAGAEERVASARRAAQVEGREAREELRKRVGEVQAAADKRVAAAHRRVDQVLAAETDAVRPRIYFFRGYLISLSDIDGLLL